MKPKNTICLWLNINGGPQFSHTEACSFQVATDNQEETDAPSRR